MPSLFPKEGGSSIAWPPLGVPCRFFSLNTCPTPFIFLHRGGGDGPATAGTKNTKQRYSCLFSLVHVQVHTINNNNVGKGKREKSAFLRICLISRCHTYMDLWGKLY